MTDEVTRALVDLTTEVRRSNERLAAIEASLEAQNANVKVFWGTHWPAITKRIDNLEASTAKLDDDITRLRVTVAKQAPKKAQAGALVVGGGATAAGLFEILKHFFGGDK